MTSESSVAEATHQASFRTIACCSNTVLSAGLACRKSQMNTAVGILSSLSARKSPVGEKDMMDIPLSIDLAGSVDVVALDDAVGNVDASAVGGEVGTESEM